MKSPAFVTKIPMPLRAAIGGAVVFELPILAADIAWAMWKSGHLSQAGYDFFRGISVLASIPSALVSSAIGFKGGFVNAYLINGLLGVVVAGIPAALWQFLARENHGQE